MRVKQGCLIIGLAIGMPAYALTQAELDSLQNQVDALQQAIESKGLVPTSSNQWLAFDTSMPLGKVSKTAMPIVLLKAKNKQLSAPVILGGQIQGDAQSWSGNYTTSANAYKNGAGSGVDLTKLYLFSMANLNSEVQTAITIKKTSSNATDFERAFITLGNLQRSPWYLEAGATYLPFGVFSGNGPLNNALTTNTFRVATTSQAILGWSANGVNANFGAYQSGSNHDYPDVLANVNYTFSAAASNITLGSSYINDIRGLSTGVGQAYEGSGSNVLSGAANPAVDFNANLSLGQMSFLTEYVSTLANMQSANGASGHMQAWMVGAVYNHNLLTLPTVWQFSYSGTANMANISMPLAGAGSFLKSNNQGVRYQWLGSISSELLNNVFVGPELVYNQMYVGQYSIAESLNITAFF